MLIKFGKAVIILGILSASVLGLKQAIDYGKRMQAASYGHMENYVEISPVFIEDDQDMLPVLGATQSGMVLIDQSQLKAFVRQNDTAYGNLSITFSPETPAPFAMEFDSMDNIIAYIPTSSSWEASSSLFSMLCDYARIPPECHALADQWMANSHIHGLLVNIVGPDGKVK